MTKGNTSVSMETESRKKPRMMKTTLTAMVNARDDKLRSKVKPSIHELIPAMVRNRENTLAQAKMRNTIAQTSTVSTALLFTSDQCIRLKITPISKMAAAPAAPASMVVKTHP